MTRIGFIGTGGISGVHLGFLSQQQDVEITALCDLNHEHLERRRQQFGGRPYSDFHQMLAQEQLDAVYLCTPPQVRGEVLAVCARQGLPAFCEKPVGRDLAVAQREADELAAVDAKVQVGYLFRSLPAVQRLREYLADDRLYAVQSLYACPMSLQRNMAGWFYQKEISGGALVDQATHNLDLLRYLLGEVGEVRSLAANPHQAKGGDYTVEEVFAIGLLFADGVTATHLHSWLADAWHNELVLSGAKRLYRLDLNANVLRVREGQTTTEHGNAGGGIHDHQSEVFLQMVRSGDWSANPCTFADGVRTLALTIACDPEAQALSSPPA